MSKFNIYVRRVEFKTAYLGQGVPIDSHKDCNSEKFYAQLGLIVSHRHKGINASQSIAVIGEL